MHYRYPFMKNVTHCCIINSHTPTTTVVFTCERTWLSVRLQAPLARWLIRGLHQAKDQKLQIPLQSRDNNLCGHFAVPVVTLIGAYFQFMFTVGCLSVFLVPPLWPRTETSQRLQCGFEILHRASGLSNQGSD